MKLRLERIIYSPRNMVWDQYTAPGNRTRWDPLLKNYRVIHGKPGHPGALATMTYQENGIAIRTAEWVIDRQAPTVYRTICDAPLGTMRVDSHFEAVDEGTRWALAADMRFNRLRLRFLSPLLRHRVRARLARDMANFSAFLDGRDREPGRGAVSLDPPSY